VSSYLVSAEIGPALYARFFLFALHASEAASFALVESSGSFDLFQKVVSRALFATVNIVVAELAPVLMTFLAL
jgi:hypothetical protein